MFVQAFFWYWVPFVPSSDIKVDELVKIVKLKKTDKFLDIWCGDGKILDAIKTKFPDNKVVWIENSPEPYNVAIKRLKENNKGYQVIRGDFFKEDWSDYQVIHTFMIPYLMWKIWKKLSSECKKWTLLISSAYEVPGIKCDKKIKIEKWSYKSFYYVYKVK